MQNTFFLRGQRCLPRFVVILSVLSHHCLASGGHRHEYDVDSDGISTDSKECQSEADLNFDTCDLQHLPKQALIDICDRVGLDMEQQVFPLLNLGLDAESPEKKERDHVDYVQGARECLLVGAELEGAPDGLEDAELSMLAEEACQSEADLNFDTCDLQHLPKQALIDICDRVGLDMEQQVFPLLNLGLDGEGSEKKERDHVDYVQGARECLLVGAELEGAPDGLEDAELSMLAEEESCQSEADLNFDTCDLQHLPKQALIDICDRVGLDMEQQVFPLLNLGLDGEGSEKKERDHVDYVQGARECLLVGAELEGAPDGLEDAELSMLAEEESCQSEADLNFDTCDLQHLPKQALIDICDRVGLDMEQQVFPLLDLGLDAEDAEKDNGDESEDEPSLGLYYGDRNARKGVMKERNHVDYVRAARECLLVAAEVDRMEEDAPDELEDLERSMLAEDPGLLTEVVGGALENDPSLLADLKAELKETDPELLQDLVKELADVNTEPEVIADLVSLMLAEDSLNVGSLLDSLDEDIVEHIKERRKVESADEVDGTEKKDEL